MFLFNIGHNIKTEDSSHFFLESVYESQTLRE